jgi:hypothetical protein
MVSFAEKNVRNRTANPGDIILESLTLEEKAKQLAVDAPDLTGEHLKVPTYFIVEYPNGEKKALHHVRDAKQISDVIRQARFYEESDDLGGEREHFFNWTGIILTFLLMAITLPILIGIF